MNNQETRFNVWDLVEAFEERYPEDCQPDTGAHDEAGYKLNDNDPEFSIGWYCAGGNMGHPVCSWTEPDDSDDYPVASRLLAWLKGEIKEIPEEVTLESGCSLD